MRFRIGILMALATAMTLQAGPTTSTAAGTIEITALPSRTLGKPRTIRVWLPADYAADLKATFDVLYMQDGQNCFEVATSAFGKEWQIDETLTKLIGEKVIPPIVVVAIDNGGGDRINELTFDIDPKHGGGGADRYARFLLDEVMPWTQQHYRVKLGLAHTLIGGSSLGGLFTLDIVRRHPGVFGAAFAMSPSIWWNGGSILHAIEREPGGLQQSRVWLDIGTRENFKPADDPENGKTVQQVRELDAIFTAKQIDHRLQIEPGAVHDETAWAKRFPAAISYLLQQH